MFVEDPRILVTTGILLAGVVDDLCSRKVHNLLIAIALPIGLFSVVFWGSWSHLTESLIALCLITALTLPLFYLKILGGGDVKLFMLVGLTTTWLAVAEAFIFSLFWGALLGILTVILKGHLKIFWNNLKLLSFYRIPLSTESTFKIPFTIAMLFGWISHLSLQKMGGSLL